MRSLSSVLSIVDVLVSGECIGLDNFSTKWIKEVVLQPCAMLAVVAAYYVYERARSGGETARKHAAGNAFFALFFCYPTICNTLFASFICTDLFDGHSVLDADDRVLCEDLGHVTLQGASLILIVLVACGVPVTSVAIMGRAHRHRPKVDDGLQHRVSEDFGMDLKDAKNLIRDIRFGSTYGFLVSAYRSSMYFWESIDMARKLLLVGLMLMFGRGSVLQLAAALGASTLFLMAHIYFLPFKLPLDNLLRFTTELHTFITCLLYTSDAADE